MSAEFLLRDARREDVPVIVRMLADDALGAAREHAEEPLPPPYYAAFEAMGRNPDNRLLVAELGGEIVGTMQVVFIPGLSHRGALRAEIEAVRVRADKRGQGIGRRMIAEAIAAARERGCRMVQLTSHASRTDAHRFYEGLGFVSSHVGMKLTLDSPEAESVP